MYETDVSSSIDVVTSRSWV